MAEKSKVGDGVGLGVVTDPHVETLPLRAEAQNDAVQSIRRQEQARVELQLAPFDGFPVQAADIPLFAAIEHDLTWQGIQVELYGLGRMLLRRKNEPVDYDGFRA